MITIKGIELKTSVKELTLFEYESIITALNNQKLTRYERFMEMLVICGLKSDAVLSQIVKSDVEDFIEALNSDNENFPNIELQKEIELNGRTYKAFDDEFSLTFKDETEITKMIEREPRWLIKAMAVIFKDVELTHTEHYSPAHLKFKQSLMKDLTAEFCIPYLLHIQKEVIQNNVTEQDAQEVDEIMKIVDDASNN